MLQECRTPIGEIVWVDFDERAKMEPYPEPEETACRAKAIYEQSIRSKVESEHHGHFVAVDIDTGQYEVSPCTVTASLKLTARLPRARIFNMRIGYPYVYSVRTVAERRKPS